MSRAGGGTESHNANSPASRRLKAQIHKLQNELNEYYEFLSQTNIMLLHEVFREKQRLEQVQRDREAQEREQQKALERQQAEERERASQSQQPSAYRGMRPGR